MPPALSGMVAVPFQELREVVAKRHALLDDELLGVAAADPQQPFEVLADDVGVLRLRVPAVALVREVGLVEEPRARQLPLALQRVHPVLDVLGRLEAAAGRRTAEAADVGFVAPAVGDLGPLPLIRLHRRFAEEQLLAEGAREHALVGAEPRDQARRGTRDRAGDHAWRRDPAGSPRTTRRTACGP